MTGPANNPACAQHVESSPLPPLPEPHWKANGSFSADQVAEHARTAWNMGLNYGLQHAQAVTPTAPTDISARLREYAGNSGYSHNDYADTMRIAADECERFYGGMMAWKQTAETKDRKLSEEIERAVSRRCAALAAAQAVASAAPFDHEAAEMRLMVLIESYMADVEYESSQHSERALRSEAAIKAHFAASVAAGASATQQPAGFLKQSDLVKLGNCRAELWAKLDDADAVPVYLGAPDADADKARIAELEAEVADWMKCARDNQGMLNTIGRQLGGRIPEQLVSEVARQCVDRIAELEATVAAAPAAPVAGSAT